MNKVEALNSSNEKEQHHLLYFHIALNQDSVLLQILLVCILLTLKQMTFERKNENSPAFEAYQNEALKQQYKVSQMQNSFFTKNSIQDSSKLLQLEISDKQTPIIPTLQQNQYSNNVLNIGFIAEESNFVLSDSQSVLSDNFSISGVSVIRANPKASPHLIHGFDEEISGFSGMDEWSQSSQISLTKRNFKRNKPEVIEDECDQIQNRLTKKKMNERNKVLTFNQSTKGTQQSGYMLRSKSKHLVVEEESSSNEDIRQILVNMQKQDQRTNMSKIKVNQKTLK